MKTFTETGYEVLDIPKLLYETILEQIDPNSMKLEHCNLHDSLSFNCLKRLDNGTYTLMNNYFKMEFLNEDVVATTFLSELMPILEKWANVELSKELTIYGVRRYKKGAFCLEHADRLPTHILSAILQVISTRMSFTVSGICFDTSSFDPAP